MRKIICCLFISVLLCSSLQAQKKLPDVYLNHLSITLDSVTYTHLFESAFLSKSFGNTDSSATTTTKDFWSGKYLFGKNGYLEFFSSKGYRGATVGNLGVGFISLRSGNIWSIRQIWQNGTSDSIAVDTTVDESYGKKSPWFYSIRLFRADDSIERFSTWLMENTPEELLNRGFSPQELQKEIPWQEYVERHSHKPFIKLFDRITVLHIVITNEEYVYLKKSLVGFGLREEANRFANDHITIAYTIDPAPAMRLRSIEVALTEPTQKQTIRISDHVLVKITGTKAIWEFN